MLAAPGNEVDMEPRITVTHDGTSREPGLQHFFEAFVPDDEESDTTEALKVFKGVIVMRLIKSDPKPAPVGDITDLFIGSLGCAFNRPALDACRVTHVLTVGCNIRARYPNLYTYKVVPVKDVASEDLSGHFASCCDFIHQGLSQGGRVLVHCFMGRSRSSAMICAYLIRHRGLRLSEALRSLRKHRPHAQPNPGFMEQLRVWEQSCLGPPPPPASRRAERRGEEDGSDATEDLPPRKRAATQDDKPAAACLEAAGGEGEEEEGEEGKAEDNKL